MSRPALQAHDLVRIHAGRRILDGLSLTAAPGRPLGLIGENGAGKTTLLRLLAGVDRPDVGRVSRPAGLGFLHQEVPFDTGTTVAQVLDDALREARAALAELDRLTGLLGRTPDGSPGHAALLDAYAAALERAEEAEVWDADRRAARTLHGLGLGDLSPERTLGSLSGGRRGRLALAALLVRRPAALLLDEPTNHLDDEAAAFVEERVRELPGVVVVASHDRAFLEAVCTELIDLDPAPGGPVRYGGGYHAYLSVRQAERRRWAQRFTEEQQELRDLRRAAEVTGHRLAPDRARTDHEKMGYGHRAGRVQRQISRRVRDAARRLAELERNAIAAPPRPLTFRPAQLATGSGTEEAGESGEHGARLVVLRDAHVPGRPPLPPLEIGEGDRLLVTGGNGAGKSTLLSVLAGRLPAHGTVHRRPGLITAMLTQDTAFAHPDRTARQVYARALGAERAEEVPLAALGLLSEADTRQPVGRLSAGQRRRLALALLVARPPHLLLLDEPTNHLSPRLCDELEEALGPGPGAIVVASHDRWLRRRWGGRELRLRTEGS
ncbi:ABC-F family ATP-binding cassette domain-containing protein [Streptomyces harbinensis]|uniref:Macrolide transport system ATP-binding/permease protein n=1 Tax=Streptomyces harbinensis TaxID=1176198 RepID=A0A1I6R176_9ACTN|nr:ABC-F family ATP-binding cassette domain-containing protein [Streptomyces harbinensis]SFS58456.1 macrolide transport system ATP-binding/permease protein [Streptomyces harbinensis]